MVNETKVGQPIIFVGGAPRSGTTVTHALLCTSARTNNYHPEISYVTPILSAYGLGLASWDAHTAAFFAQREHFRLHIRDIANGIFAHLSRVFGMPESLCVKDPMLTPHFPSVNRILEGRARFITVIRHPYDVVRSRQEVAEKDGKVFDEAFAEAVAREYLKFYLHLDNPGLASALMTFRYEDILKEETLRRLREFTGFGDISPENVWSDRRSRQPSPTPAAVTQDPWHSPKYEGAISLDRRLDPLEPRYRHVVDRLCGAFMERFDYKAADHDETVRSAPTT